MKLARMLIGAVAVAALFVVVAAPAEQVNDENNAEIAFRAALQQETVKGDLKGAILQYQKILVAYPQDRSVAARALLHIGECYEKLGQSEAHGAYARLLHDYADQSAQANEARAHLAALEHNGTSDHELVMRRIWTGPDVDNEGAPSQDGKYLSYVDWSTGDLAIHDLATGEERRLTHKGSWTENGSEFAESSVPSPDGKQVAYAWFHETVYGLRVVAIDGSGMRTLFRSESVTYLEPKAWTPDGKQILAKFLLKDGSVQIVMVSVADGSVKVLKSFPSDDPRQRFILTSLCISPDGRYIAYSPLQDGDQFHHDISLLPIDGSKEIPIVTHAAEDYFLGWVPDGKTMLFASDRTGPFGAWTIEVIDGKPLGSPKLLKPEVGHIMPLGFTQNGSLYYSLDDSIADLYTASVDLASEKVLAPPTPVSQLFTGTNCSPAWSPDGRYLAYMSLRHQPRSSNFNLRSDTIVIRSLETGEEREVVPKLEQIKSFGGLRWSPDGRYLLVNGMNSGGHLGLFRVDVQTADTSMIADPAPSGAFNFFPMTPDGRAVVLTRTSAQGQEVVLRDLESGNEHELLSPRYWLSGLALSPDGGEIAFDTQADKTHAAALMILPLSGGEPKMLYTLKSPAEFAWNSLAWAHDGRHIVFGFAPEGQGSGKKAAEIWEIDAHGGEPHKLEVVGERMRHLRINPDDQHIAFEAGSLSIEVGVMENLLPTLRAGKDK